jgi:hypothetical protein
MRSTTLLFATLFVGCVAGDADEIDDVCAGAGCSEDDASAPEDGDLIAPVDPQATNGPGLCCAAGSDEYCVDYASPCDAGRKHVYCYDCPSGDCDGWIWYPIGNPPVWYRTCKGRAVTMLGGLPTTTEIEDDCTSDLCDDDGYSCVAQPTNSGGLKCGPAYDDALATPATYESTSGVMCTSSITEKSHAYAPDSDGACPPELPYAVRCYAKEGTNAMLGRGKCQGWEHAAGDPHTHTTADWHNLAEAYDFLECPSDDVPLTDEGCIRSQYWCAGRMWDVEEAEWLGDLHTPADECKPF